MVTPATGLSTNEQTPAPVITTTTVTATVTAMGTTTKAATTSLPVLPKKGGRPRGSTKAAKQAAIKSSDDADTWLATEYMEEKEKSTGKRLPKGTFGSLCVKARKKFQLSNDHVFHASKICMRGKRQNPEGGYGPTLPIHELEPTIAGLVVAMDRVLKPLDETGVINLDNSLMSDDLYRRCFEWKVQYANYVLPPDRPDLVNKANLGTR